MIPQPAGHGWIEVITGCMFSGKTEELIRRLERARIARQQVLVFKPARDVRYSADDVVSHRRRALPSVPVARAADILAQAGDAQVVGVDEAQFFEPDLVDVCNRLADEGRRVVVAGLDQDYLGEPFEPIPHLLAVAEYITKYLAVCMVCGAPADRSQRIVSADSRVLLGSTEAYEARCRRHWSPDLQPAVQERLPLP